MSSFGVERGPGETIAYDFSLSLRDGVLPIMWKKATVTAIHKKGNRNLPNNYRPVSLTSVICKILETIVIDEVLYKL